MINNNGPNSDPCGLPRPCHAPPVGLFAVDLYYLLSTVQPLSYPFEYFAIYPMRLYLLQQPLVRLSFRPPFS